MLVNIHHTSLPSSSLQKVFEIRSNFRPYICIRPRKFLTTRFPQHPLSVSKIRPPKLQLTFNDKNITLNMSKWETYRDAVKRLLHV